MKRSLTPAKKRALHARRRNRMLAVFAGLPAAIYLAYRLYVVFKTI